VNGQDMAGLDSPVDISELDGSASFDDAQYNSALPQPGFYSTMRVAGDQHAQARSDTDRNAAHFRSIPASNQTSSYSTPPKGGSARRDSHSAQLEEHYAAQRERQTWQSPHKSKPQTAVGRAVQGKLFASSLNLAA